MGMKWEGRREVDGKKREGKSGGEGTEMGD